MVMEYARPGHSLAGLQMTIYGSDITADVYSTGTDAPCSYGLNLIDMHDGRLLIGFYLNENVIEALEFAIASWRKQKPNRKKGSKSDNAKGSKRRTRKSN